MMNLNEMIERVIAEKIEGAIESAIANALGSALGTPQVANAEVVEAPKAKTAMTREEFLATVGTAETKSVTPKVVDLTDLDLVNIVNYDDYGNAKASMKLEFNMDNVPSDVWAINFLNLKEKYSARYNNGYFVFKSKNNLVACMTHYQVVKHLSVDDYNRIIAYKQEKMDDGSYNNYQKAKAEKDIAEWTEKKESILKNIKTL